VAHEVDGGKREEAATGRDAAGGRRGETEGAQRVGTVAGWRQNNLCEIEPTESLPSSLTSSHSVLGLLGDHSDYSTISV